MINIAQETLDLRCVRISRTLWLLMPTFLLPYTPRWVTPYASAHMEHSPTAVSRYRSPLRGLKRTTRGLCGIFSALVCVKSALVCIVSNVSETRPISSVLCLAPLHFRRKVSGLVSYYALFKGWLLLSQPPRCLRNSTSFPT